MSEKINAMVIDLSHWDPASGSEWASGSSQPQPRLSSQPQLSGKGVVAVDIAASDGVRVNVSINGLPYARRPRHAD
jgi:hypothetical protein